MIVSVVGAHIQVGHQDNLGWFEAVNLQDLPPPGSRPHLLLIPETESFRAEV